MSAARMDGASGATAAVIGVGCDIVQVERIARIAARDPELFRRRVFGAHERAVLETLDARQDWPRWARHVAAKEAFFKALGTGLTGTMRWSEVQVVYVGAKAHCVISGEAQRRMRALGATTLALSLAGQRRHAIATVLLMGVAPRAAAVPEMTDEQENM